MRCPTRPSLCTDRVPRPCTAPAFGPPSPAARSRAWVARGLAAVAVVVAVLWLCVFGAGCSSKDDGGEPVQQSTTTTQAPRPQEEVVALAIAQVQTALGLAADAVSKSSTPAGLTEEADVLLKWEGGRAEVDVETGRILTVVQQKSSASMAGALFTQPELEAAALEFARLLGWDAATLAAEGFIIDTSGLIAHAEGADEYHLRWAGHDSQGALTGALIDIRLDASTKSLRSFLFIPPPKPEEEG